MDITDEDKIWSILELVSDRVEDFCVIYIYDGYRPHQRTEECAWINGCPSPSHWTTRVAASSQFREAIVIQVTFAWVQVCMVGKQAQSTSWMFLSTPKRLAPLLRRISFARFTTSEFNAHHQFVNSFLPTSQFLSQ